MGPQPPDPDYLPDNAIAWAHENREHLELVANELLAIGSWPSLTALTRKLAQDDRPAPLSSIFHAVPKPLGFVDNHPDRVVLLLFGLRMTHAGHTLLADFMALLRLAVERYQGTESKPIVTRTDAARTTSGSDLYIRALSEILIREAPFLGPGHGGPDDEWSREVTHDVVRYWHAGTPDDYLRTRAAELAASPQFGWPTAIEQPKPGAASVAYAPTAPESAGQASNLSMSAAERDAFISHAGEDKDDVARPLAKALRARGHSVWFDEDELVVGDSLSDSIDWGLAHSRFGVVILSRAFFGKPWPRRELRGLVAREMAGHKRLILPVWHGIDQQHLVDEAPPLADLRAVSTGEGIERVADEVSRAISISPRGPAAEEGAPTPGGIDSTGARPVDHPLSTERELLDAAVAPSGAPDHRLLHNGSILLRLVARPVPADALGPTGAEARQLLERATKMASQYARAKWRPAADGQLLREMRDGWKPAEPRVWHAGWTSGDASIMASRPTAGVAVSTRPLVVTVDRTHPTTVRRRDGDVYYAAHDPEIAADTAAVCVLVGACMRGAQGIRQVDLLVQIGAAPVSGPLVGAEAYTGRRAPFAEPHEGISPRPPFVPTRYLGLTGASPRELIEQPEGVASRLLDDWLVTFRSASVFDDLKPST